jgi:hypothetical protein
MGRPLPKDFGMPIAEYTSGNARGREVTRDSGGSGSRQNLETVDRPVTCEEFPDLVMS